MLAGARVSGHRRRRGSLTRGAKKCASRRAFSTSIRRRRCGPWARQTSPRRRAAGAVAGRDLSRSALAFRDAARAAGEFVRNAGLIAVVLWGAAALVEKVPLCALSAVIAHAAVKVAGVGDVGAAQERRRLGPGRDFGKGRAFVGTLVLGATHEAAPWRSRRRFYSCGRDRGGAEMTVPRGRAGGRPRRRVAVVAGLVSLDEEARSSLVVRVEAFVDVNLCGAPVSSRVRVRILFAAAGSAARRRALRVVHLLHRCDRALGARGNDAVVEAPGRPLLRRVGSSVQQ